MYIIWKPFKKFYDSHHRIRYRTPEKRFRRVDTLSSYTSYRILVGLA